MKSKRLSVQYVKLAVNHIVDKIKISLEQKKIIDTDKDGIVTIDDVISLTRSVLDVSNPPPSIAQKSIIHRSLIKLSAFTNLNSKHRLVISNTIRHTDPLKNLPTGIKKRNAKRNKY
tara:strand:- start:656 stop:1006 length:351 start_codon:yes stop_codon:yes gene_type:complete